MSEPIQKPPEWVAFSIEDGFESLLNPMPIKNTTRMGGVDEGFDYIFTHIRG